MERRGQCLRAKELSSGCEVSGKHFNSGVQPRNHSATSIVELHGVSDWILWCVEGFARCLDLDYLGAGVSSRSYCGDFSGDSLVSPVEDQAQGACLKRNQSHHVLF